MSDLKFLIDRFALSAQAQGVRHSQQHRLYLTLRQAIQEGALPAGSVLPGSRTLCKDLAVARNSVIHAYEQLAAEGYVQSSRLGTVVAALPWQAVGGPGRRGGQATMRAMRPAMGRVAGQPAEQAGQPMHQGGPVAQRAATLSRLRTPQDDLRPFMPGMPALDQFPMQAWRRLMNKSWHATPGSDLGYRYAHGEPELRQAIATYLRVSRGVKCVADQVVVTDGTQHSLSLCAQLLADAGDVAWIEHPGYGGARMAFEQAGLQLVPMTVDWDGMVVQPDMPASADASHLMPRLIYVTPSHQYPLGSVLSLSRRLDLIRHARQCGAWILEDDYDSEFRHDGPPLSAMQGLEDDAPVVYLGTYSKSLFPGLRLGYMVLPDALVDRMAPVLGAWMRSGRTAEQRALAAFINEGHYTTHLRRMRKVYQARQAALREALHPHAWAQSLWGGQCGMHLTLALDGVPDGRVAQCAYELGLHPRPLSAYGTGGPEGFNGLVMGYGHVPEARMAHHVRTLDRAVARAFQKRAS